MTIQLNPKIRRQIHSCIALFLTAVCLTHGLAAYAKNSDLAGAVELSIRDAVVNEANANATVSIELSTASNQAIEATVYTAADSAQPGRDYYGNFEIISFAPGQTSKLFQIAILDDTTAEQQERFNVYVSNVSNATIADGSASVTINDDDQTGSGIEISVNDLQIEESTAVANVQLRLSEPSSVATTVRVSTRAETATPGQDFYGKTNQVTFPAGQTEQDFQVTILNDAQVEASESFVVNLANPSNNAVVARAQARVTIRDDDADDAPIRTTFYPLQAENHDAMQGIQVFDTVIGFLSQDDWIRFDRVDFGPGANELVANLAVPASNAGGQIEVRIDSLNGNLAGSLTVADTGGWDVYQTQSTTLTGISGIHDVYIRFAGNDGIANIDWFQFSPRTAPAPAGPISADLFGMHSHTIGYDGSWPAVPFAVYRIHDTAGAFWRDIEPSQDNWNWQQFDRIVDLAGTNNAELLYTLGQTPAWAALYPDADSAYDIPGSPSRPRDMQDWTDYVRAVAERYRGRIKYYEIWNEVDQITFYVGGLDYLVEMAREAHRVIKAVDPTAIVIAPSFVATDYGIDLLDQYLQKGGGELADVINMHLYLPGITPPEEIPAVVSKIRLVMRNNGQSAKPLWNTESNFGYIQEGQQITGETAMGYVARAYLVQWHSDVRRHYWYAWENTNFVGIRFVDPATGQPTEATIAYTAIQDWMIGKTMQRCSVSTNNTWVCELRETSGKAIQIAWNRDGIAPYTLPAGAVAMRRLTGERVEVQEGTDIDLSIMPVYIEFR